jgi:hypothetical protein
MVPPVDQANGIYAYAWAKLVESVMSTIMLLITPTLPFKAPFRARLSVEKMLDEINKNYCGRTE